MTQLTPTTQAEPVRESGDGAADRARAVAAEGKEQVGEIAQHARQQASDLVGNVRGEVRSQTDQQARRVNAAVRDVGRQLRDLADGNASDGPVRSLAREAADRVEAMTNRFESSGLDGALSSVRDFARRRPIVFLAGSLAAGMLVGRVLRNADTEAIMQGGSSDPQTNGGGTPATTGRPTPGTSASSADAALPGMPAGELADAAVPAGSVGPETGLTRSTP